MSEKPQIKLVTRGRYTMLLSSWLIRFQLAWVCSILGVGLVVIELYDVALGIAVSLHAPIQVELPVEMPWQGPKMVLIFLVGVVLALAGRKLFAGTGSELPFTPITRENTHLLPSAESLVRASMPGPQSQQAELLRAAPNDCPDNPQEKLLRASQSPD
ncbi:MAG: hypothetical protein JWL77_3158 [Chthonomonadaceae bacterium]|nr:hypothetical protein [Chthonomonadaceae bacterium]